MLRSSPWDNDVNCVFVLFCGLESATTPRTDARLAGVMEPKSPEAMAAIRLMVVPLSLLTSKPARVLRMASVKELFRIL